VQQVFTDRVCDLTDESSEPAQPAGKGYEKYVEDVTVAVDKLERRKEEEISQFMLEGADVLVIGLRPDGIISIFNRKCQELTGYTKSEVVGGMSISDLLIADGEESAEGIMERFSNGTLPRTFISRWRCKGGKECHIRWTHSTITDAQGNVTDYLGMGENITQRHDLELELERTKDRYTKLVHSMPLGVLLTDAQGQVQLVNEKLNEWLEAVKRPDRTHFNVLANPFFVNSGLSLLFRRAINNKESIVEKGSKFEGRANENAYFNIHVAPILDGAEVTGTTAIFEDITERKHLEYEAKQSQAFMASALEQSGLAILVLDTAGTIKLFN